MYSGIMLIIDISYVTIPHQLFFYDVHFLE
jgi:hypothetical protein